VGKTVAAAAFVHRCRKDGSGRPVKYWKPIQTGIEQDDDTREVRRLAACSNEEILDAGVRLERPLSPHLSARLAGTRISLDDVQANIAGQAEDATWVVEGAGGVLVPVNDSDLMIDLMARLALPVAVVARSTLGTINHTLLTLEALRARHLTVAGVLLVGERNVENRDAIAAYGHVRILGEMPTFVPLTPDVLGAWARAELMTDGAR
jgi:dethiobiotin synthetase